MAHRWSQWIRRCLAVAAALAVLAGGLAPSAVATSPFTVLTPSIIDLNTPANAEIANPGRGLYKWRTPLYVCDPLHVSNRDAYERWEWKDLETAQGVYNWSGIQAKLTEAQSRGQQLWIGLAMAVVPPEGSGQRAAVPAYMVQSGWGEWYNNAWYPDYNQPAVQLRMEALLDSFVAAFPNEPWIAGVQMRTYGQYGEIYIPWDAPSASPIRATAATAEWMINAWHSRLSGRYRLQIALTDQQATGTPYANNNQYIFQYAMTKSPAWGWYRDALGHTVQMENIDRAMASTATVNGVPNIGSVIRERWKTQPVFTEMIGGYLRNQPLAAAQAQFALAASQVLTYHVSLVSNGNFVNTYAGSTQLSRYTDRPSSVNGAGQCVQRTLTTGSPVDWTQQNINDFVLAGKRAGYRYAIPQVAIGNTVIGRTAQITTTWRNDGAAPIYAHWPVKFQLRSGAQTVWQGTSAADLRTVLPAETPGAAPPLVNVGDSFTLPLSMTAGTYALHVLVGPTAPFTLPLNLAIGNRQSDGSYLLGNVAVQPVVAFASATATAHESAGVAAVEIRLNAPSALPVTVNFTTSSGTALAGSDFTASSGSVTFNPGQTSQTVNVPLLE
ncbi:MAG TPA: Calx-beta domain-containing protein, partial [Herpetosiphonaceae bacterium]